MFRLQSLEPWAGQRTHELVAEIFNVATIVLVGFLGVLTFATI